MVGRRTRLLQGVLQYLLAAALFAALLTPTGSANADAAAPRNRVAVGGGTGLALLHGAPLTDHAFLHLCTLTAIGYDAAGNLIGLTNAHCEYEGGTQWLHDQVLLTSAAFAPGATAADVDVLGTVEYISGGNPVIPGPNGPGLDYAVIVFDKAVVAPVATVAETTIRTIASPPAPGTGVCKQGATSGRTCGIAIATVGSYMLTTVPEYPGDSGAPVVAGDALLGNQWVWGGGSAMSAIVSDLDRRGGIGAGFHLAAG